MAVLLPSEWSTIFWQKNSYVFTLSHHCLMSPFIPSFLLAKTPSRFWFSGKTLMLDLYCKRRPWTQELKPRRLLTWCKSKMTLQHFGDIERKLKSHLDSFLSKSCTKNSAIFWSAKVLSRIFKGILLLSQCLKTSKKSHFILPKSFRILAFLMNFCPLKM